MNTNFPRIERLPAYVFAITNELKAEARARGEDIIDFGMGNPDQPTPKHIVEKLVEAARRPDTHRYSASRGIKRLRVAICNKYKRLYNVDLDPENRKYCNYWLQRRFGKFGSSCGWSR
jgi:alanine-synthesizing transaminase